jgi:hypothetical protein
VAAEKEPPTTWGDPAPSYEDVDDSTGATGYAHDGAPDGTGDGAADRGAGYGDASYEATGYEGYETAGTGAPGWEIVAPVAVSENGHRPVSSGGVSATGWPLHARRAPGPSRREHRVLRGIRSGLALTVIALALGVAAAASLGLIVWLIATAIHHAAAN